MARHAPPCLVGTGVVSAETFAGLVEKVTGSLASSIIKFIFALAFIYFFWGVGQSILSSGDEKGRAEGKQKMIWGIVALFVTASIWGILTLLSSDFGFSTPLAIPQLKE